MKKNEFKDFLSLAKKESYFVLNNLLYKQTDEVAIVCIMVCSRSAIGPSLCDTFLA